MVIINLIELILQIICSKDELLTISQLFEQLKQLNIINIDVIEIMNFMLSKTFIPHKADYVGLDLRNSLMHGSFNFNYQIFLKLFYLLMIFINELHIYVIGKDNLKK